MDYAKTLDKALFCLRDLQIDKALVYFYQLLETSPLDMDLLIRVVKIESKRSNNAGIDKIARHIFTHYSNLNEYHELLIEVFITFKKRELAINSLNQIQINNLIIHLSRSYLQEDADALVKIIKATYPESVTTAETLFLYSERLVEKKRLIKAKEECRYIYTYYGELAVAKLARTLYKTAENRIIN